VSGHHSSSSSGVTSVGCGAVMQRPSNNTLPFNSCLQGKADAKKAKVYGRIGKKIISL
jgi:hypothetical protein